MSTTTTPTGTDVSSPILAPLIYLLAFLSGSAALVYETVWGRQLATFLGITSYAHTAVVASFMFGLAIGSWLFGRRADRTPSPLRLFSGLEIGIAAFGALSLFFLPFLQTFYAQVAPEGGGTGAAAVRFLLATAALLAPAILMGGTLPTLVQATVRRGAGLESSIARLYGANTLGAAAGALASGYFMLPAIGGRRTVLLAVAANLCIAAVARSLVDTNDVKRRDSVPVPAAGLRPTARVQLLVIFALSGFAALAAELAWIRALTQVIGSSVYAFSLTLAVYLLGTGLGSYAAAPLIRRFPARKLLTWGALLAIAVGIGTLAGIPLIGYLPDLFLYGYQSGVHATFLGLQLFVFALTGVVVLIPTLLLGALFPVLASLCVRRADRMSTGVGIGYAVNSLGTVLGSLAAGLLLLPQLGAEELLHVIAGLFVCCGAVLWLLRSKNRRGAAVVQMAALLVAVALVSRALPRWERTMMTSGVFINASRILVPPDGKRRRAWLGQRNRIVYYREGAEATVSVRDVGEERLLVINGKTDGSRFGDRRTQLLLAHLPLLMHSTAKDVLMIGLGTGMSAAAAATHEQIENLSVVEISPEVVEASGYFLPENDGVLDDPRVRLIADDARSLLLRSREEYDVILSEPSNPWITGVANLFTHEFFTLAGRRLADGGIMAQWFHTYGMQEEDLRSVLASFAAAFPEVNVWVPQLGDLLIVGSRTPRAVSLHRLGTLLQSESGGRQLRAIEIESPAAIAGLFLFDDAAIRRFVSSAPLNTDDHPRVEFNAPRSLYSETTIANLHAAIDSLDGRELTVPFSGEGTSVEAHSLRAFGLELTIPEGFQADAVWRASWTKLGGSAGDDLPRVGVGRQRLVILDGKPFTTEILRSDEPTPLDRDQLMDRLRRLLSGSSIAAGDSVIGDQTAVWMENEYQGRPYLGLSWLCPQGENWSRHTALTEHLEVPTAEVLATLSDAIRCTGR